MKNFTLFVALLLGLGLTGGPSAFGQPNVGDIAFTSYSGDGNDVFTFVLLIDLPANTPIRFTDNKILEDGTICNNEGILEWVSDVDLPAGTEVQIDAINLVVNTGNGTVTEPDSDYNFSSSGDQIIAYTGSESSPRVIAGVSGFDFLGTCQTVSGGCSGNTNSTCIYIAGLVQGYTAVGFSSELENGYYNRILTTGTRAELLEAINNPDNWIRTADDAGAVPPTPETFFSVTAEPVYLFWEDFFVQVNESETVLTIAVYPEGDVQEDGQVDVTVNATPVAEGIEPASQGDEFQLETTTLFFPAGSFEGQIVTITLPGEDDIAEATKFIRLRLANPTGGLEVYPGDDYYSSEDYSDVVVYLHDNDGVPTPAEELLIEYSGRYRNNTDPAGNTLEGDAGDSYTAEIVAFDPLTDRLFVANGATNLINVLDVDDALNVTQVGAIDCSDFGPPNSVAVGPQGLLAAVLEDGTDKTLPGRLYVFETDLTDFTLEGALGFRPTESLPDMVTFSPDGATLLVANEGEPNDYTPAGIDPVGSVSVIVVPSDPVANPPSTWTGTNMRPGSAITDLESFVAEGGRFFGDYGTVDGLPEDNVPTAEEDMEPEYIAVSDDGTTAYITLQENNAVAILDISDPSDPSFIAVVPLGTIPASQGVGFGFDASDDVDVPFIATWPVEGQPMPDAIAYANIGGTGYLFTANEGDAREYVSLLGGGEEESDDPRFGDVSYSFDEDVEDETPNLAPNFILSFSELLGRLRVDWLGDTNRDGGLDVLRSFGTRSFSIWYASTGVLAWDSGNLFEKITSTDPRTAAFFNASNTNEELKNRSDDKGPEPEAITVKKINDVWYAFIGLERIGGVMVFNVNDPENPVFEQYLINNRPAGEGFDQNADDLGPEDVKYVRPEDSPTGEALLIVANEVSGTIQFYSFPGVLSNEASVGQALGGLRVSPNPVQEYLYVRGKAPAPTQAIVLDVFDLKGTRLKSVSLRPQADGNVDESIYVGDLQTGLYVVTLQQGGLSSNLRIVKQ